MGTYKGLVSVICCVIHQPLTLAVRSAFPAFREEPVSTLSPQSRRERSRRVQVDCSSPPLGQLDFHPGQANQADTGVRLKFHPHVHAVLVSEPVGQHGTASRQPAEAASWTVFRPLGLGKPNWLRCADHASSLSRVGGVEVQDQGGQSRIDRPPRVSPPGGIRTPGSSSGRLPPGPRPHA